MRRNPRTEVVSVRLTKAERERLNELGGPSALLRRALDHACPSAYLVPVTGVSNGHGALIWSDGTCGPLWPALSTM